MKRFSAIICALGRRLQRSIRDFSSEPDADGA